VPEPNFRIKEFMAYIAIDPQDNSEGIMAFLRADGTWMPAIGADGARIESLRPKVIDIAKKRGIKEVRLIRVSVREDIETIKVK
jgi:hypothetical protein